MLSSLNFKSEFKVIGSIYVDQTYHLWTFLYLHYFHLSNGSFHKERLILHARHSCVHSVRCHYTDQCTQFKNWPNMTELSFAGSLK